MATARQLPSGAYQTRPSKKINGKIVTKSFTVHPRECGGDAKRAKTLSETKANNWLLESEADDVRISVGRAMELYIEDRSAVLSPSTIADYKRMPKHFGDLVNMIAADVDTKTLQAFINEMAMENLNARTIKNRVFFLISALNYVGVEKKFKLRFPTQIKPNLNPPEPSEFTRLLDLATPEEKLTIILAGLYTLRRGEIAGLCGEDLLWDLNSIYVHTSRVQNDKKEWVRRPMPKNLNSVRMIQLDPEIMSLLPKVGPKEYVISMNPNEITKHFIRLREKACVSCRFHDLRKYAASIRSAVMPSRYVEADGGWRKGSQVLSSIYDKPFKESRNEYSKKLNGLIMEEYGEHIFRKLD
jgi:integrase